MSRDYDIDYMVERIVEDFSFICDQMHFVYTGRVDPITNEEFEEICGKVWSQLITEGTVKGCVDKCVEMFEIVNDDISKDVYNRLVTMPQPGWAGPSGN